MKMDEFKEFVKNKPHLKTKVDNGETSWQELYEHYDLYGEEDEIFKQKKQAKASRKDDGIGKFFDMISDVDVDKISEGLNGMKKILSILSEVTSSDDNTKKNHQSRVRDDD